MTSPHPSAPDDLAHLPEVSRIVQRSPRQIRRDVAACLLPAPMKIGARAIAWRRSDIAAWIAHKLNQPNQGPQAPRPARRLPGMRHSSTRAPQGATPPEWLAPRGHVVQWARLVKG